MHLVVVHGCCLGYSRIILRHLRSKRDANATKLHRDPEISPTSLPDVAFTWVSIETIFVSLGVLRLRETYQLRLYTLR
jgi:hypothetical protein